MAWAMMIIAGFFEIIMALGLKFSEGFTRLWPTVGMIAASLVSFYCLSRSLKEIPIGTAYAVWTGIGAAGTAILGMIFFGDSVTFMRIFCIFLIIAGVIGLKVV